MFLNLQYSGFSEYIRISILDFTQQYFWCLFKYRANTYLNFGILPIIKWVLYQITKLGHIWIFDYQSNFGSAGYNSMYQLFWYIYQCDNTRTHFFKELWSRFVLGIFRISHWSRSMLVITSCCISDLLRISHRGCARKHAGDIYFVA